MKAVEINRPSWFIKILIVLFLLPSIIIAQEDVLVEFPFHRPNEYVCDIRNMTDCLMKIWFNKEDADIRSNLYFYKVNFNADTIREYAELTKEPELIMINLDSGGKYSISHKMSFPENFVKVRKVLRE